MHATEVVLSQLRKLCEDLALSETDLDEHVHDVFDAKAASAWNSGEGADSIEGCGEVHETYSERASSINNQGIDAQLRCLIEAHGPEETERLLRESA